MKGAFVRYKPQSVHELTKRMRDAVREHQYVQQAAFGASFQGWRISRNIGLKSFFGLHVPNQYFGPVNPTVGMNHSAMYPHSGTSIYGTEQFIGVPQGKSWPYQNEPAVIVTFAAMLEQQQTQKAVEPESDKLSGGLERLQDQISKLAEILTQQVIRPRGQFNGGQYNH